jgi:hypothetical protein
MTKTEREAACLRFVCPSCHAEAGSKCKDKGRGRLRRIARPHPERIAKVRA